MEAAMRSRCECRLTVIGSQRDVQRFQASAWEKSLRSRYAEPLELSPCRFVCQFQTETDPLPALQRLSRRCLGLVFLLDYETTRCKGLAMAKAGRLTQHRIRY
jgi:hypothetical protein